MTTMYIPEIGTELEVATPWTFTEYDETNPLNTTPVTFPMGTVMIVDRIYVRSGKKEFSSITLRVTKCSDLTILPKGAKSTRIWVKLIDFNTLDANVLTDTVMVPGTVDSCGAVLTMSDFRKKMIRRYDHRGATEFWVKGTIDGKVIDNKVITSIGGDRDVYYEHPGRNAGVSPGNRYIAPSVAYHIPGQLEVYEVREHGNWLLKVYPFDPKVELKSVKGNLARLSGTTSGTELDDDHHLRLRAAKNLTQVPTKNVPGVTYDITFHKIQKP
jgi:hypothetical protein